MNDEQHIAHNEESDSVADVIAAIALVTIFVAVCIFWVSAQ